MATTATAAATTASMSQRLKLAPPPPSLLVQKSRPGKSNIAQAARASQFCPAAAAVVDVSAQLAGEQTFGLPRRNTRAPLAVVSNEENISNSCDAQQAQSQLQVKPSSERPTVSHNSRLKHLQNKQTLLAAAALASANSSKQPTWKSSTSGLYSSQQQQQAIERRRRGATATASLTAATSLLQLNTTTSASPNCQSASSACRQQQQQRQQQLANQRRASSLAAEISFLKSRSCGSTQHLEALRESQARRVVTSSSRVLAPQQRAKSVIALNTYPVDVAKSTWPRSRIAPTTTTTTTTTTSTTTTVSSKTHLPAAARSSSVRAALHQQAQRSKQPAAAQHKPTAAVTNSRVRQGVLFARRQLHLAPRVPIEAAAASVPTRAGREAGKTQLQVTKSSLRATPEQTNFNRATTTATTTTCRRQLTRLTRAQPRPLAAKKQAAAAAAAASAPAEASKLASVAVGPIGHVAVGSARQRAHLLFESASRRARAGHSQTHAKQLSVDSSSSSSLDAPVAHIKRPRADPEQAQSPSEQLEKRRASLVAPGTGKPAYRRRWSSLESASANEVSSTPVSRSSLSSSSSTSCLVAVAVSPRDSCAPVDTHEERSGRQRRRRHSSAAEAAAVAAAAATTGNRHVAATVDAATSVGASRARQHVVRVAAASAVDPLANTREQQEKVPNANDDERICDSHSKQHTNLDYSSTILISSDTDKLFSQQQQQQQPGQAVIICQSQLRSNLDSNQRPGTTTEASNAIQNNNNNNNNNQCVCIVGRQPSSIGNADCDANCPTSRCFHSKSLKHQPRRRQSIGDEDVSAPTRVAERAFSLEDKQQIIDDDDDNEENEPMVLSADEPQHYQSSELERLESTQIASPPLSQLNQHQQQQQQRRRRQSQSSLPMSCDLGVQGEQDENTNIVAISPCAGAHQSTLSISEQPSEAKSQLEQISISQERRASINQAEMPTASAQLKSINIDQIQNKEPLPQAPATVGPSEDDESSADELGPASKRHQPESIAQPLPIKSDSKTDYQISICQEPIGDVYDLETRPFARGKFAQVKRCVRRDTRQCFAAKCIKKRRRLVDIKHEILLEIEALKLSYQTEYIVKLYEVYETPNEMVLILEMANGGELQRVLDDEESIEEPLVRKMIKQILEGLVHLHDNHIAHLDIKPQNLLLTEPFPNGDVKLCDFGISRRITKDCEIRDICGTPDYVAPEILRYDPISLATDMWSLGVLTYVLLSGYSPFGSENKQQTFCNITQANLDFPIEIFSKISEDAVDFIRKLIVREPSGRLTSRQARSHHWINQ